MINFMIWSIEKVDRTKVKVWWKVSIGWEGGGFWRKILRQVDETSKKINLTFGDPIESSKDWEALLVSSDWVFVTKVWKKEQNDIVAAAIANKLIKGMKEWSVNKDNFNAELKKLLELSPQRGQKVEERAMEVKDLLMKAKEKSIKSNLKKNLEEAVQVEVYRALYLIKVDNLTPKNKMLYGQIINRYPEVVKYLKSADSDVVAYFNEADLFKKAKETIFLDEEVSNRIRKASPDRKDIFIVEVLKKSFEHKQRLIEKWVISSTKEKVAKVVNS